MNLTKWNLRVDPLAQLLTPVHQTFGSELQPFQLQLTRGKWSSTEVGVLSPTFHSAAPSDVSELTKCPQFSTSHFKNADIIIYYKNHMKYFMCESKSIMHMWATIFYYHHPLRAGSGSHVSAYGYSFIFLLPFPSSSPNLMFILKSLFFFKYRANYQAFGSHSSINSYQTLYDYGNENETERKSEVPHGGINSFKVNLAHWALRQAFLLSTPFTRVLSGFFLDGNKITNVLSIVYRGFTHIKPIIHSSLSNVIYREWVLESLWGLFCGEFCGVNFVENSYPLVTRNSTVFSPRKGSFFCQ